MMVGNGNDRGDQWGLLIFFVKTLTCIYLMIWPTRRHDDWQSFQFGTQYLAIVISEQ